jgi:hypothetical protein
MKIDRPVPIDPEKINKANIDLSERLNLKGVRLTYDEDGDTLFVSIGEPVPSIAKPTIDGIYIQIDPSTYKIVGCTILAFATDFLGKNKLIRKTFPDALDTFKASGGTLELKGRQAEKTRLLFEEAFALN